MPNPPQAIEAILFSESGPMTKERLRSILSLTEEELQAALNALTTQLTERGIILVETDREVELRTAPSVAPLIKKLHENDLSRDLGKAGLETLAVVAYKNGATRGEIDWVRGVNSSASLRTLLVRGLIEGREDEKDRRRMRYTLTTDALAHLGLTRTEDLPRYGEFSNAVAKIGTEEPAAETAP